MRLCGSDNVLPFLELHFVSSFVVEIPPSDMGLYSLLFPKWLLIEDKAQPLSKRNLCSFVDISKYDKFHSDNLEEKENVPQLHPKILLAKL